MYSLENLEVIGFITVALLCKRLSLFSRVYCLLGQRMGKGKYYQQIFMREERDLPRSSDLPKDMKEAKMEMKLRLSM